MNKPFVRGKDATLRLFFDGKPYLFDVQNWRLGRNATVINDDVCGEDRSRLDSVTNFYSLTVRVLYSTAEQLKMLLKDQENDDAGAVPLDKQVAGVLREKGGGRAAFRLTNVVLDDWDIGAEGRADAVSINLPLRCQYVDEVKVA